jgi:nitroreductase
VNVDDLPSHLQRILDLARWAPSGDNTQPWRFEVVGDEHIVVHGFDTRDHVVYDLDGHASQLAVGALLETIAIAAGTEGRRVDITRRADTPETHLRFDVRLMRDPSVTADPLASCIERRVVQRRPMSTKPLSADQKSALESALPVGYRVTWFEGPAQRWRMARFMFANAKLRLTIPEAYQVHKAVIEWGARYSEDRIPEQAVGVDPLTARLMRWAMVRWERVAFLNTWLLGTLAPRVQLDLLPGLRCAAHVALRAPQAPSAVDDFIAAGRAMQRFWLTATAQGLFMQPEMTPVIFCRYHRAGRAFTQVAAARAAVACLDDTMAELLSTAPRDQVFFMGRLGTGPAPRARSTRLPVARLMWAGDANTAPDSAHRD